MSAAGRSTRTKAQKGDTPLNLAKENPANEFAQRHFLVFHNSVSRERRIHFQILINAATGPAADKNDGGILGTENCELRMITDPAHPAFRQFGLFATKRISSSTVLTPYAGLVSYVGQLPSSQCYIMSYGGEGSDLGIDAEYFGNYARFANDPRGTGRSCNAFAQMKHTRLGEQFTALISKKVTIYPGEEILLDYGKRHRLSGTPCISRKGTLLTHARPAISPQVQVVNHNNNNYIKFEREGEGAGERAESNGGVRTAWSCLQCGNWNDGGKFFGSSSSVAVICVHCLQPRAMDTISCIVAPPPSSSSSSSSTTSRRALPSSATNGISVKRRKRKCEEGENQKQEGECEDQYEEEEEEEDYDQLSEFPEGLVSPRFVLDRESVINDIRGGAAATTAAGSSSSAGIGMTSSEMQKQRVLQIQAHYKKVLDETTIPASWPLHFPFISWQIWDPEVSIFSVNTNAKEFTSQTSLSCNGVKNDGKPVLLPIPYSALPSFYSNQNQNNHNNNNNNNNNSLSARNVAHTIANLEARTKEMKRLEQQRLSSSASSSSASTSSSSSSSPFFQAISVKGIFSSQTPATDRDELGHAGGIITDPNASIHQDTPNRGMFVKLRYLRVSRRRTNVGGSNNNNNNNASFGDFLEGGGASIIKIPVGNDLASVLSSTTSTSNSHSKSNAGKVKKEEKDQDEKEENEENDEERDELLLKQLIDLDFYITNEIQHIRVSSLPRNKNKETTMSLPSEAFYDVSESALVDTSEPNATLEIVLDTLGFIYIALIATRDIEKWGEVIL